MASVTAIRCQAPTGTAAAAAARQAVQLAAPRCNPLRAAAAQRAAAPRGLVAVKAVAAPPAPAAASAATPKSTVTEDKATQASRERVGLQSRSQVQCDRRPFCWQAGSLLTAVHPLP